MYSQGSNRYVKSKTINKRRKIKKEEIKLSLFVDNMMYAENPKESIEKQLKLISKLTKTSEYKIKIASFEFLCISHYLSSGDQQSTRHCGTLITNFLIVMEA